VDDTSRGYRPLQFAPPIGDRDGDRLSRSARAEWRALSWLRVHALAGRDELTQDERRTFRASSDFPQLRTDTRHWQASSIMNATAEAEHRLGASTALRTLVSYEESSRQSAREARTINESQPQSCTTALCEVLSASGSWLRTSTRSWMVQERIAVGDRFFVNVGARRMAQEWTGDDASWHPSVDAAWDVGRVGAGATLRVRGAYAVGVPPHLSGILGTVFVAQPVGSVPVGVQPQVTRIEPERPREAELGLDASFGTRAELSATVFDQQTPDLITVFPLPAPSAGFSSAVVALGRMENRGLELMGRVHLVDGPSARWTAAMTFSAFRNRVSDLDEIGTAATSGPGVRDGQPYGVFMTRRVIFVDANGDNLPSASEITFGDVVRSGSVIPTREVSARSELALTRWGLALSATLDHRGGHRAYNMTEYNNCIFRRCRAWQDPSAPLADKVEVVASSMTSTTTFALEDASYTRLGELALEWTPSARLGRTLSGLTIAVEARNLVTWTRFGGPDPEVATTSTARHGRQQIEMLPALPRTIGVRIGLVPR
jgi:hypothetical protein